jgi:hypothetical protein
MVPLLADGRSGHVAPRPTQYNRLAAREARARLPRRRARIGAAPSFQGTSRSGSGGLNPTGPSEVSEPALLRINGRPPAGHPDGSRRFLDGADTGTPGSDAVAILSRGGASVEAVATGATGGQNVGITAVVDALFERDAFAGLATVHRRRPQRRPALT